MTMATDLDALGLAVEAHLGPPPWAKPDGYPESVALCIIDSIWSIGVRYQSVVNVVNAYRQLRSSQGGDADHDSASALIATIDGSGGTAAFADVVKNRQLTSSRGGTLKADAVRQAAEVARAAGVETVSDLRALDSDHLELLGSRWSKVKGQGSGLSFTYFSMLAGIAEVKADRMVCAFVRDALGRDVELQEAHDLVVALHERIYASESLLGLDHAIWTFQSGRDS